MMNNSRIIAILLALVVVMLAGGCRDIETKPDLGAREVASNDPPYFGNVIWPETCSELPEGRLIITGSLVCPAGYDSERPIQLFVFPGYGLCGEGEGKDGGFSEGINGVDCENNPFVIEKRNEVLNYLAGQRKGQSDGDDEFPEDCQRYCVWLLDNPKDNNEYSYFHPQSAEIGRFRLDFDQWCRFTPYDKVLVLVGIDSLGQAIAQTNIYRVAQYSPETLAAGEVIRHEYMAMMSEFAQGMLDALAYYPLQRRVDISAITAGQELYEQAYGGEVRLCHYSDIGEEYGQEMDVIALQILDPVFREGFNYVANYIEDEFKNTGDSAKRAHFQYLFAEWDPVDMFWETLNAAEEFYTKYPITVSRELQLDGSLVVTIDIERYSEPLAHIVMTGSPSESLVVTGWIGDHTIVEADYNPYFIELFAYMFDAGFIPCISY